MQHIVETTIAGMIDPDLKFQVEPRPKFYDPGEAEATRKGAKALEWMLDWQLEQDRFQEKQRDMLLQERVDRCQYTFAHEMPPNRSCSSMSRCFSWKRSCSSCQSSIHSRALAPFLVASASPGS